MWFLHFFQLFSSRSGWYVSYFNFLYHQIVPTLVKFRNGTSIQTNQYSVTEHMRHVNPGSGRGRFCWKVAWIAFFWNLILAPCKTHKIASLFQGLPGVFFFYEISPLHVEIVEGYRKGYIAFFTSVCAIVGGVVTTMGLLDQLLYSHSTQRKGNRGLVQ